MFSGSIVAIVTPFLQGQVDLSSFVKLLHFHINQGTHGLVVAGSTGEGTMLTMHERQELLQTALQIASSKFPIIAGCSSGSTHECLVLLEQAQKLGCAAALVVPPYYVKPRREGVLEHFKKITELTHIPILLYNNPGRVGIDLPVDLVLELAQLSHIVGIKDSHPNLTRLALMRKGVYALKKQGKIPQTKPFSVLAGDSSSFAPALALGADGCISVTANVLPGLSAKLYSAWKSEDMATFAKARDDLLKMDSALECDINPVPIKYAVSRLGFCANEMRLPLIPLDSAHVRKVNTVLDHFLISSDQQAA